MASEKNTEWTIKKLGEPVDEFVKLVQDLEKKHRESTEETANISRQACQDFLDNAKVQIGRFEGFKAAVAQAVDRQTDKLQDRIENLQKDIEDKQNKINDVKASLKEAEELAKRNETFPEKVKHEVERLQEFIEAEVVR